MTDPGHSTIEQLAHNILQTYSLRQHPVDPVALANKLGIAVHNAVFPDNSTAAVMTTRWHTSKILVAVSDTPLYKRHSIAHMLGHYLIHPSENITVVDDRHNISKQTPDPQSAPGTYTKEDHANIFAAALLMPADQFRQKWATGEDQAAIASAFKVTEQTARARMDSLGLRQPPNHPIP